MREEQLLLAIEAQKIAEKAAFLAQRQREREDEMRLRQELERRVKDAQELEEKKIRLQEAAKRQAFLHRDDRLAAQKVAASYKSAHEAVNVNTVTAPEVEHPKNSELEHRRQEIAFQQSAAVTIQVSLNFYVGLPNFI